MCIYIAHNTHRLLSCFTFTLFSVVLILSVFSCVDFPKSVCLHTMLPLCLKPQKKTVNSISLKHVRARYVNMYFFGVYVYILGIFQNLCALNMISIRVCFVCIYHIVTFLNARLLINELTNTKRVS